MNEYGSTPPDSSELTNPFARLSRADWIEFAGQVLAINPTDGSILAVAANEEILLEKISSRAENKDLVILQVPDLSRLTDEVCDDLNRITDFD